MLINQNRLSVRKALEADFENIIDYFLNADKDFLIGIGADIAKLPKREEWLALLLEDFQQKIEDRKFFYVIWLMDNEPVGHSNINKIVFGEEAYMHLHLWNPAKRRKGAGAELVKRSLPYYFETFKLKIAYCEPYAFNPAPNKTLEKIGFDFTKQYETTPGCINYHQTVNRWCLTFDKFQTICTVSGMSYPI
ncbi:MAG: GNAT family N-acetyltransferase [Flavisolibacter sp.]|nr:GNAT family N-acetyltransferase [Flavisolibacter sp.]